MVTVQAENALVNELTKRIDELMGAKGKEAQLKNILIVLKKIPGRSPVSKTNNGLVESDFTV